MYAIGVSDGGGINGIWIYRVNDDPVNVPCILQPHSLPSFARIQAFEDPFANIHGVPWVPFSGSNPNNIWIGLLNGNGAYVLCWLVIENRRPGVAAIFRFPHA